MKQASDLHRIVQEVVDLTNGYDNNGNSISKEEGLKMPELALSMAKYFNALSKYCLSYYNSYEKKPTSKKKHKFIAKDGKGDAPPRKPLTAYIAYYQQKVPVFQQKYSNYSISELTRLIAKQWSDLPEEEKNPYTTKAANDRKRYEQEREQYKVKNKLKKEDTDSEQEKVEQVIEDSQLEAIKQVQAQQKQKQIQNQRKM